MFRSIITLAVLLIISRTAFSSSVIPEIRYQIKKSDLCIQVMSTFNGHHEGITHIMTPWASFSQLKDGKINYNAEGGIQVLEFNGSKTKVSHAPNAKIEASYELCYDEFSNETHLHLIQSQYFHLYSLNLLVYPELSPTQMVHVSFDFSALPDNFALFSDFGKNKTFTLTTSFEKVLSSQFIGKYNNFSIETQPVTIIENARWSLFDNLSLKPFINDLINFQRKKMQDEDFPPYVISLAQQSKKVTHPSVYGTHSKNCLTFVFPDGPKEKRFKVIYLLSHELFHSWLGSKLEIPLNLRHKYRWFFEGFTDYFGLQVAKEQGYITAQEYADILNYHLEDYHSSFLSNLPNDLYGQAHHAGSINYNFIQTRGHLLAIHFQNLIKEKNLPTDTLVHFIKSLIADSSSNGQLSEEVFWNVFNTYFDNDFKTLVEKYIHNGAEIETPDIPGYSFIDKEIGYIMPGFDIIESIKTHKITHLETDSPAFIAGLENNAVFLDFKTWVDQDGNELFSVFVLKDEQLKEIRFSPSKAAKKVRFIKVGTTN